jgi:hypothetical protein
MDAARLLAVLAHTRGVPRNEQFAIAAVVTPRDGSHAAEPDGALSLLELLAYVGDVLSADQDRTAEEAFVDTSYNPGDASVAIRLANDLRPVAFAAVDASHAFVVVIGAETGDSTLSFGDGDRGRRPPAGLEHGTASYRHGGGGAGNVQVRGLPLRAPIAVITLRRRGIHGCQILR